ncbi:MAG: hypothetical protein ACI4QP_01220 [Candidatus Enteromonas sp.]
MKKSFLLLLSCGALLISCGRGGASSDSSASSATEPSADSSLSSSESSSGNSVYVDPDAASKKAEIREWITSFKKFEGKVAVASIIGYEEKGYMTSNQDEYFVMATESTSTRTRYGKSSVGSIVVEKGTIKINEGDPEEFEKQTYHDDTLYYALTSYGNGDKTKEVTSYQIGLENTYLNLSFYQQQYSLLTTYMSYIGKGNVVATYSLPKVEGNKEYEMSYSVKTVDGTATIQEIAYTIKFNMVNGYVDSSLVNIENKLYVGNTVGQYVASSVSSTYDQGDYKNATFEGNVFNPSEFGQN